MNQMNPSTNTRTKLAHTRSMLKWKHKRRPARPLRKALQRAREWRYTNGTELPF